MMTGPRTAAARCHGVMMRQVGEAPLAVPQRWGWLHTAGLQQIPGLCDAAALVCAWWAAQVVMRPNSLPSAAVRRS